MNYWTQSSKNIYVAAHRGFCAKYPENTIEAFRAAIDLGVDQIETDVRITADGELVLIHDSTLDRTTDATGRVRDKTYAELCKIDAGVRKGPQFAGARIPTLRELFELVKDLPEMTLDLELKEYTDLWADDTPFSVCDRVVRMVDEYGFGDRVVYNSSDSKLHEYFMKKYPDARRHLYFPEKHMRNFGSDVYVGGYCACVYKQDSSDEEIKAFCDKYGIRPWAPAGAGLSEEALDDALSYGFELITCNDAESVINRLAARGLRKKK